MKHSFASIHRRLLILAVGVAPPDVMRFNRDVLVDLVVGSGAVRRGRVVFAGIALVVALSTAVTLAALIGLPAAMAPARAAKRVRPGVELGELA